MFSFKSLLLFGRCWPEFNLIKVFSKNSRHRTWPFHWVLRCAMWAEGRRCIFTQQLLFAVVSRVHWKSIWIQRVDILYTTIRIVILSVARIWSFPLNFWKAVTPASTECLQAWQLIWQKGMCDWPCRSGYSVIRGNVKCFTRALGEFRKPCHKTMPHGCGRFVSRSISAVHIHIRCTEEGRTMNKNNFFVFKHFIIQLMHNI